MARLWLGRYSSLSSPILIFFTLVLPEKLAKTGRRVRVNNADLIFYSLLWRIILAFVAGILGTLGFTVSWIAIGLAIPSLFKIPNSLTFVVFLGAYSFAFLTLFRNRIVRRMAKHGFLFTLRFQRLFFSLFWVATLLAVYGYLARTQRIPEYSAALSLLFMGFYFLLTIPWLTLGRLIPRLRETRLSIIQFLTDLDAGKTNYYWLEKGLSGVERQFRKLGYSVPKGDMYVWACFSLYKSVRVETQLKSLSDWVRKPEVSNEIEELCTTITIQARAADRERYRSPRGRLDLLSIISSRNFPRWWDRIVTAVLVFLFGSVMLFLVSESDLVPVPAWYLQGASLALLSVALPVVLVIANRKPSGEVRKLVSGIYPTVRSTDDVYDEDHFWDLVKLISEKREAIHSLEPTLQIVAPKLYQGLSAIISALEVDIQAEPNSAFEISKTLFRDPQSRRLVSDLRVDCKELLSKYAYVSPES